MKQNNKIRIFLLLFFSLGIVLSFLFSLAYYSANPMIINNNYCESIGFDGANYEINKNYYNESYINMYCTKEKWDDKYEYENIQRLQK